MRLVYNLLNSFRKTYDYSNKGEYDLNMRKDKIFEYYGTPYINDII